MSDGLPEGWSWTRLDDVCLPISKSGPRKDRAFFRYIDLGAIDNRTKQIIGAEPVATKNAPSRARQIVKSGDVLFSNVRVYLENIAQIPDELNEQIASTAFCVLRPATGVEPRFIYYLVTSKPFIQAVNALQRGNSPPSVQDGDVRSQSLPFPPSAEQKRITSKIDELFSRIEEGERALEQVQRLVERYRQSVLKAAVTGELTREWREKHKGKLESGEALLARILKARREAWEKSELGKMKAKGQKPANDNWKRKYKEPGRIVTDYLNGLPSGWVMVRVDAVGEVQLGRQRAPRHHRGDFMRPYLRVANVFEERIDLSECKDKEGKMGAYLFAHASDPNQPVPKVNNAHDRAVRDSKVAPFRLYDLRHTWATRAVEAGIDLVTLAAMLGHSKINMVLRYAHPTQEHQTKAMEKMEQFVAAKQIEAAEMAARQQGMSEMAIQ